MKKGKMLKVASLNLNHGEVVDWFAAASAPVGELGR
jgi:hypothetical protein